MNRYPMWKYAILVIALLAGLIYTLPNFFPNAPAVQVSSGKVTSKVDDTTVGRVQQAITQAGLKADFVVRDGASVRARFADFDTQAKAKDAIVKALNPDPNDPNYIVALQLLSRSPTWLTALNARPMNLGLDLLGGVHFLLQVDMKAPIAKKAEALVGDVRVQLREKNLRHAGITKVGNDVEVRFRDRETLNAAKTLLSDQLSDEEWIESADGAEFKLTGRLKPESARRIQEQALKKNITTLHNRINELVTKEPVIQQQGLDRIVVELPGLQDPAKAKDIIGRTATLQVHMVEAHLQERSRDFNPAKVEDAQRGLIPPGTMLLTMKREGREEPLLLSKEIVFSGDNLTGADANIDQQNSGSIVIVSLDAKGGTGMKNATRDGVGRRMAVVLIEKGKPDVLTAPTIQSELGNRFNITGMRNPEEANDLALLMRAGSLAAPMEFIEEKTIGPTLGADNIAKGFDSVKFGFVAIAVFMCAYYLLFGAFSTLALAFNLLLLVAVLSLAQATLTLPGIAAIALTLGMAIDANVLINERIREELRGGAAPQAAINIGYERAFATILDSNVTTLIAGLALLAFGSGPVRGFAVVHCLGILTSMFSAVVFSRGLVNLWYGRQKKLKSVSIGQIWKSQPDVPGKA